MYVNTCAHPHMYISTCTYHTCINTHAHPHISKYTQPHTSINTRTHPHMHAHTLVHAHTNRNLHMVVHRCARSPAQTHTHACTHTCMHTCPCTLTRAHPPPPSLDPPWPGCPSPAARRLRGSRGPQLCPWPRGRGCGSPCDGAGTAPAHHQYRGHREHQGHRHPRATTSTPAATTGTRATSTPGPREG